MTAGSRRTPPTQDHTRRSSQRPAHRSRIPGWGGTLILALVFLFMLWWSWGKWPDLAFDFGRELYVPWQLMSGKVLYRDLVYFNGPLSPYVNTLWFRLFGVSLRTLVLCNLAILIVVTSLLYRLLTTICRPWSATLACVVFLIVFACGQLVEVGNYNFVCPYSHDLTHGLALSLAALTSLSAYLRSHRMRWIAVIGVLLGLIFLTKTDVFLAAACAIAVGLMAIAWWERPTRAHLRRLLGFVAIGVVIPPLLAWTALARAMPWAEALEGTLGTWIWILHRDVFHVPFYSRWMGINHPGESLWLLGLWTARYLLLAVPVLVIAWRRRVWHWSWGFAALLASLACTLPLQYWCMLRREMRDMLRPLPLVLLVLLMVTLLAARAWRRRASSEREFVMRLVLPSFALGMLGKMVLFARFYNIGFAHAMLATLLSVIALVDWAPQWIERHGGEASIIRMAGCAILTVFLINCLTRSYFQFSQKQCVVASGADAFMERDYAVTANQILAAVTHQVASSESLAIFPRGEMMNYLARRDSGSRYYSFAPFELLLYGEDEIVRTLDRHPPEYVAIMGVNEIEEGAQWFGRDYGFQLAAGIARRYHSVRLMNAPSTQTLQFEFQLLQRNREPTAWREEAAR